MRTKKKNKFMMKLAAGAILGSIPAVVLLIIFMFMFLQGNNTINPQAVVQITKIPVEALKDAAQIYSRTDIYWLDLLAAYAIQYGQDWEDYACNKLEDITSKLDKIKTENEGNYNFYKNIYQTIYAGLIDTYDTRSDDGKKKKIHFYYKSFFPIAKGEKVVYGDDFMDPRDFEDISFHDGNDLVCDEGIPIIAVEEGVIETMGWNPAGGWRIGIKNGDRFWYYAHMRKVHPYYMQLKKGDHVEAGQVIGYVGSTGYSHSVPDNVMPDPDTKTYPGAVDSNMIKHLHIGLEVKIKFGDGDDDYIREWVNPYPILKFLQDVRVPVKKEVVIKHKNGEEYEAETGDYIAEELEKEDRVFATRTENLR